MTLGQCLCEPSNKVTKTGDKWPHRHGQPAITINHTVYTVQAENSMTAFTDRVDSVNRYLLHGLVHAAGAAGRDTLTNSYAVMLIQGH